MRPPVSVSSLLILHGLLGACADRKPGGSNPSEEVSIPTAVCRRGEVHLAGTATATAVPASPNNESRILVTGQIDCAGKPVPNARLEVEFWFNVSEFKHSDAEGKLTVSTSRIGPVPPDAKVVLRMTPSRGVTPVLQELSVLRQ